MKPALLTSMSAAAVALAVATVLIPAHAGAQSFTNIADTTMTAPGQTVFTGFNLPAVSGNNVAFWGQYSGGRGIYTGTVGAAGAAKIVDITDTAPGQGAFSAFSFFASVSGNRVAFMGSYLNNSITGEGIYTGTVGATGAAKIVDFTDTAPGHGVFTGFGEPFGPSVSGSSVAFFGSYGGGDGIYAGTVGAVGAARIADRTDSAPGHGAFTGFGRMPAVSGSNVAFTGMYSGGVGIYSGTVGAAGATKIVDTTDVAPGHGVFTNLSPYPSVSGSSVAFYGSYSGGSALYTGTVGVAGATKLVETGDIAPGHGAFTGFGVPPSISGSNVVFSGSYIGGSGIFLESGGTLSAVLNTGDALFGSTVSQLGFSTFALDGNDLALSYTLANGVSGVAVAQLVPEPASTALVGLGTLLLAARRRRSA